MLTAILASGRRAMSAATWLESAMVIDGRDEPVLSRRLDDLVRTLDVTVVPVTLAQAVLAREAFRLFGKGRHRAHLNFGDCFSYALAAETGEALLCKGDDFRHTDLEIVDGSAR